MVMTRSRRVGTKKVRKKSSNVEAKNFYQDGSAMDPIDVEPFHYAPPPALVPYKTSEDEAPIANTLGLKQNSSIESHNA